jgi:two-component system CitB family sensor kinase
MAAQQRPGVRGPGLHATVLAIQVAIVLAVVAVVSAAFLGILTRVVAQQSGERVLGVAHAVALMPAIRDAIDEPDAADTIQPLAEAVRQAAGLTFVVVANRDKIRLSHPNPERIGQEVSTDPQPALDRAAYVISERGTLGQSIRAKVPIYDEDGEVIGAVSVGILDAEVQDLVRSYWPALALIALGALAGGGLISFLLSSHIKRQIFGLEPREIAGLLEQREAMLHGIREGVVAIDGQGAITLVNDEARRLLDLTEAVIGRAIAEVLPESGLPDVLATGRPQQDGLTLARSGRAIVVNRMPVRLHDHLVGAIATFRDQTDVQRLARELTGTRGHLDALRAQAHEFANRLHTISGLIELGLLDRAVSLIRATTDQQQQLIEDLPLRIGDPALAALLVGKSSVAVERGINMQISPTSRLGVVGEVSGDLLTIVGNLIENAFDATDGQTERVVDLDIREEAAGVRIAVRDSGPGIPPDDLGRLFESGFTTKDGPPGAHGIGLALVRRSVSRWGGELMVRNDGGAVFEVWLPLGTGPARPSRAPYLPLTGSPVR